MQSLVVRLAELSEHSNMIIKRFVLVWTPEEHEGESCKRLDKTERNTMFQITCRIRDQSHQQSVYYLNFLLFLLEKSRIILTFLMKMRKVTVL